MSELISNKEMADYLNRAMNLPAIKKFVGNGTSAYGILGNWFAKYYISTGDDSMEGIIKVIKLYRETYEDGLIPNPDDAFMELLMKTVLKQNGKGDNPSLIDKYKAFQLIVARNQSNLFYMHCFPGALIDTVSRDGLDGSRELFRDEIRILERFDRTTYRTGNVCYCEMCFPAFNYAETGVPERINFSIGNRGSRLPGESKLEYYLRTLKENLAKSKLSLEEQEKVFAAGKKILVFYCSDNREGIAIFREHCGFSLPDIKFSSILYQVDIEDRKFFNDTIIGRRISSIFSEMDSDPENGLIHYDELMEEIKESCPDLLDQISRKVDKAFYAYIRKIGIRYYDKSYSDGYEVPRMPREDFEIVVTETPFDMSIDEEYSPKTKIKSVKEEDITDEVIERERLIKYIIDNDKKFTRVDRIDDLGLYVGIEENGVDFFGRFFLRGTTGSYYVSDVSRSALEIDCKEFMAQNLMEICEKKGTTEEVIEQFKNSDTYKRIIENTPDYFETRGRNIKTAAFRWMATREYEGFDDDFKQKMIVDAMKRRGFTQVRIGDGTYEVSVGEKGESKTYTSHTVFDETQISYLNSRIENNNSSFHI